MIAHPIKPHAAKSSPADLPRTAEVPPTAEVPRTAEVPPTATVPRTAEVTLARGDGIGPEIVEAVLLVLKAAGARVAFDEIEIGEPVYLRGVTAGIDAAAWDSLRRTRVFLKGPVTTPLGSGYKSLNVTARKTLGLYANVRPCSTFHPFVRSRHPGLDVVIVRENEEDTYAGIEHRQTAEVTQCLKLITRPGCERIVRYAFEYARRNGRRKVTCMTKDNIMKLTDGLFHRVFEEVRAEYADIATEHMIIDIGTARLADDPTRFDVIVTPNLYGDIISDVVAQISGSVGLAGSANIGTSCAMFEAVHGSAPDIAGKDIANPSGLLQAATMMLLHLGQGSTAAAIQNAFLRTLEDGVHTPDVYRPEQSTRRVGTLDFAAAVASRLGLNPRHLPAASYPESAEPLQIHLTPRAKPTKTLQGVDVFFDWDIPGRPPESLGQQLERLAGPAFSLKMLTNRGVKVYPNGLPETFCSDHWRARFVAAHGTATHAQIIDLLSRIAAAGLDFIKTEHLCSFDGERGYSLGQGE
jgi:isocitrate dehydrogenase